jgi:hypothetical protein
MDTGQALRVRGLPAWCNREALSALGQPADEDHARLTCLVDQRQDGSQAASPVQPRGWLRGQAPFPGCRQQRPRLIPWPSCWLEGLWPRVSPDRPPGQARVRHDRRCGAGRGLRWPLERPAPPERLGPCRLDGARCCTDWWRPLFPLMILAHRLGSWGLLVVDRQPARGWRLADHTDTREPSPASFVTPWLHGTGGAGQQCLGDAHASRTYIAPQSERVMAVFRLHPIKGEANPRPRAPGSAALCLVMGHRGPQGHQDRAQPGHLWHGSSAW